MLPGRRQGVAGKLIGLSVEEIMSASFSALNFLKAQKDYEQKYQMARLAGCKKAYKDLKSKKELETKKHKEIEHSYRKLMQDRELLLGIGGEQENDCLTQELLDKYCDIFDDI